MLAGKQEPAGELHGYRHASAAARALSRRSSGADRRQPPAELSRAQRLREPTRQCVARRGVAKRRQVRDGAAELPRIDGVLLGGGEDRSGHRADEPAAAGRRPRLAAERLRRRSGAGRRLLRRYLRSHPRTAPRDRPRPLGARRRGRRRPTGFPQLRRLRRRRRRGEPAGTRASPTRIPSTSCTPAAPPACPRASSTPTTSGRCTARCSRPPSASCRRAWCCTPARSSSTARWSI